MPNIELLGLAKHFAGVSEATLPGNTLSEILQHLTRLSPNWEAHCAAGTVLPPGLIVCLNERRFTRDLSTPIQEADRILILSADVGGT